MPYKFTSPFAAFSDSIEQALVDQDQRQRQALLDSLTQQNIQSQVDERKSNAETNRLNAESMAGFRQASIQDDQARAEQIRQKTAQDNKDAEVETAFGTWLEQNPTASGGDMRKFLTQHGYSMGKVNQTVKQVEDAALARTRMNQQVDQFKQAEADRVERANADRASREMVAGLVASSRNDALAAKNEREQRKIDDKTKTDNIAAQGVLDQADAMQNTLNRLLIVDNKGNAHLDPGLAMIVGTGGKLVGAVGGFIGGNKVADAKASLEQLKSQSIVNLIQAMKQASRTGATGFGQLSDQEGKILASAAARLDQAQTPQAFTDALHDVQESINRIRKHGETLLGGSKEPLQPGASTTIDVNQLWNKHSGGAKPTPEDYWKKFGGGD